MLIYILVAIFFAIYSIYKKVKLSRLTPELFPELELKEFNDVVKSLQNRHNHLVFHWIFLSIAYISFLITVNLVSQIFFLLGVIFLLFMAMLAKNKAKKILKAKGIKWKDFEKRIHKKDKSENQTSQEDNKYECIHCGTTVEEDDEFCQECGKNLEEEYECVKCGTTVKEDDEFCPKCGENLEEE